MQVYVFDGSFSGLLCCVFEAFEMKQFHVQIISESKHQPNMFDSVVKIFSDDIKANRVWKGLELKINNQFLRKLFVTFLSENESAYQFIFNFCLETFKSSKDISRNFGNDNVMGITQIHKSVTRESHRMKAFIRFKKSADGLFYCLINPDFNVLPLIVSHFKNRYSDQFWIIYDESRNYGFYYNLESVQEIFLENYAKFSLDSKDSLMFANDVQEELYNTLWKNYFKSTNILERKNLKLHVQHVPKRYWKYLNEKQ